MALLTINHLSKSFGEEAALTDVNLTIEPGRIIGLLGKNGAGKTTLLKLICDLLTPTDGEVLFEGAPIGVESKKEIAFLPERTYLDKSMTIQQTLRMFQDFYDNFDVNKAKKLLADLDLPEDRQISKLSKGMQEKLQLVLVMARKAKLYILDEPLGGVDPATRDYILDTILRSFDDGASLLISTHLIADIERILDDVIFLDRGKVLLTAQADDLRNETGLSVDDNFRRMFKC
ncbi:MAG: ABC transporter ATP-binding protein [Clostridia bacterium]|nr:ABC transporter ATP-binding protein [Clostridia bacterium]